MYYTTLIHGMRGRSAPTRPPVGAPAHGRGTVILFTTMILSLIFLALASGLVSMAVHQTSDRVRYGVYKDEFAASEEALNKAFAHVQFLVRSVALNLQTEILATPQPVVPGFDVSDFAVQLVSSGQETITEGRWVGWTLNVLHYRVSCRVQQAAYNDPESLPNYFVREGVTLAQNFDIAYIPLYYFGIFYDSIIEFTPGPAMTINGRVHCNGDAFFQSDTSGGPLTFTGRVSIAGYSAEGVTDPGDIYHGRWYDCQAVYSSPNLWRLTNGLQQGDVRFPNLAAGSGTLSMKRPSGDPTTNPPSTNGWYDCFDTDWILAHANRWGGGLEDSTDGVMHLDVSMFGGHSLIERASSYHVYDASWQPQYDVESQNLEKRAGIVIEANGTGVVTMKNNETGATISNTYYVKGGAVYSSPPSSPYTTKNIVTTSATFYDLRECKTVYPIDVNVAYLREASALSSVSSALTNKGVVYVSGAARGGSSGMTSVRLTNATQLPVASGTNGFTVASDRPVYVKGDYNTTAKTMALVAGDAITVLSNAWLDSGCAGPTALWTTREATNTTVNGVFMNGIVPTPLTGGTTGEYSGSVSNFFRLLEDWNPPSGKKTFSLNGSIIQLWDSLIATSPWHGRTPHSPVTVGDHDNPNRILTWDPDLLNINGPPSAPSVVEITRTGWELTNSAGE